VQARQRIGKTEQTDSAGQKEERARGDGGDRHDVEHDAHHPSVSSEPSASRAEAPFLTKAIEAKVASSASVSATSTAAGTPVTAPSRSSAAMPPVPTSCVAIMRSASPGPRRTRTSPSASIARIKPRATIRNSLIAEHPGQRRLLRGELLHHRLADVKAVVHELSVIVSGWHCPRQQTRQRGERVT